MRWAPSQAAVDDDVVIEKIETQMRGAMEADAKLGADGEWVGLLGFSQGAKVAASVLYESQLRGQEAGEGMYAGWDGEEEGSVEGLAGGKWRFGVFMAGSPPLVSMRGRERARGTMPRPGELTDNSWTDVQESMYRLRLPTVHVHGLRDGGLPVHRQLMNVYCEKGTTALVEWDGDHRVPIKSSDVKPVIDAIFNAARVRLSSLSVYPHMQMKLTSFIRKQESRRICHNV